jgi:hypothetical protein
MMVISRTVIISPALRLALRSISEFAECSLEALQSLRPRIDPVVLSANEALAELEVRGPIKRGSLVEIMHSANRASK